MRVMLILVLCWPAMDANATSYRRPDRPSTPAEQIELAQYDEAMAARKRRLETRIAADAEVQQMLAFVLDDDENADISSDEYSARKQARFTLAMQDELAGLIWASYEYDRSIGSHIRALEPEKAESTKKINQLITRWKPTGSSIWGIFAALLHENLIEQKQLLSIVLKKPLHSGLTKRARVLALRYFEIYFSEPEPDLREALTVYRPDYSWMQLALLGIGGIDLEGLVASKLLDASCDLENPREASLSASDCQSLFWQSQLLKLMMPEELPAELFEEPVLSAFLADQQLVEQTQATLDECGNSPAFVLVMLRATSSADWRGYLRKVASNTCSKYQTN
jgi:hypothetical protein